MSISKCRSFSVDYSRFPSDRTRTSVNFQGYRLKPLLSVDHNEFESPKSSYCIFSDSTISSIVMPLFNTRVNCFSLLKLMAFTRCLGLVISHSNEKFFLPILDPAVFLPIPTYVLVHGIHLSIEFHGHLLTLQDPSSIDSIILS